MTCSLLGGCRYSMEHDGYSLDDKRQKVSENDIPDVLDCWNIGAPETTSATLIPSNAFVSVAGSAKSPRTVSTPGRCGAHFGLPVIKRNRRPSAASNSAVRRLIR